MIRKITNPRSGRLTLAQWLLTILVFILAARSGTAATFTVTNANDSGPGSLRQAVLNSNSMSGSDTIVFDPGVFNIPKTITLATTISLIPAIGDSVTITGPGANLLTISGNNAVRIFSIPFSNPGHTVSLSGLTLTKGSDSSVGAISSYGGQLTLTNIVVTQNTGGTGGIYSYSNGSLTLTNVDITENTGTSTGGGIRIDSGALNINGGSISNNACTGTGSGLGGAGGGIYSQATMNMSGTTVSGNTGTAGGGIYSTTGSGASASTITGATISGNTGTQGGGLYFNNSIINITNTVISNNRQRSPGNSSGGGIFNFGVKPLTIANCLITGNSANGNGGGIYSRPDSPGGSSTISDSTISNNISNVDSDRSTDGGGVYLTGEGAGTIIRTLITGNTARYTQGNPNSGRGGGVAAFSAPFNLNNSTVSGNTAGLNYGGVFDGNPGGSNDIVNIADCTIANNTATIGGIGGYGVDPSDAGQGSIRNTIVANNLPGDVGGPITSLGYNLIGTGGSSFAPTTGDQVNVDPLLDPAGLKNNGGPTLTIALQAGSPAIDKGKSAGIATDQRGLLRPYDDLGIPSASGGDGSDIGAFETQPLNTLIGSQVAVGALAGDASVTFASISQSGFTTFTPIDPPSSAGALPQGYSAVDGAPAYDIMTNATYTAPLTVCFTVSTITDQATFSRVRILHGENGILVDRTDLASIDSAAHTVCAQVDSLSPFVVALAPLPPNRLQNISTRLNVETGDNVLIGGFIVTGTGSKSVLLRAIGPSLADAGIASPLADPILELHRGDGSIIMSNDDWQTTQKADIIATGIPPRNDKESAIVADLTPGNYTVVVGGNNGGTGVGLVEAYDLAAVAGSEFANISTRGKVGTGNDVLIGGFILGGGTGDSTVLVRALGPSLTDTGVSGALTDPTLELRNQNGTLVRSNDNWMDEQMDAIVATGIPPTNKLESALVQTLSPGAYTAIVFGKDGGIGVGLVEAYRLP